MTSSPLVDAGPAVCRRHHDAVIYRGLFRGMTDGRLLRCPLGLCSPGQKHRLCKHCCTLPYVALPLHQVFLLHDVPRRRPRSIPGAHPATSVGSSGSRLHPQLARHATTIVSSARNHKQLPNNGAARSTNDENDMFEACAPEHETMVLQTKTGSWERLGKRVRRIVH